MDNDALIPRLEGILSECRSSFDPFRVEEGAALVRVAARLHALLDELRSEGSHAPRPLSVDEEEHDRGAGAGSGRAILVIDGPAGAHAVPSKDLEAAGHAVRVAGDGDEGLEMLDGSTFDLILVSEGVPDGEGLAFCARLAQRRPGHGIPIVLLTGRPSAAAMLEGRRVGAVAWIVTPVDPAHLIASLGRFLSSTT